MLSFKSALAQHGTGDDIFYLLISVNPVVQFTVAVLDWVWLKRSKLHPLPPSGHKNQLPAA